MLDLQQDIEERIAIIGAKYATGVLSNQDFVDKKSEVSNYSFNAQIALIHEYIRKTDDEEFLTKLRKKETDIRQGSKSNTF